MKKVLVVDIERCLGCKTCELACAVEHSVSRDLAQAMGEVPAPQARVRVELGANLAVPLQCRQCDDAPCIQVCPAHALHRDPTDAPVLLSEEDCSGCGLCVLVCPFGAITLHPGGKVAVKCDLCYERLKRGELPACVEACPTGALELRDADPVAADKRQACLLQCEREVFGRGASGGKV